MQGGSETGAMSGIFAYDVPPLFTSRAQVEERELPESRDDLAPTPVWDALATLVGFPCAADRGEIRRAPREDPLVWAEGEDA